jgi:hypothetical protein
VIELYQIFAVINYMIDAIKQFALAEAKKMHLVIENAV